MQSIVIQWALWTDFLTTLLDGLIRRFIRRAIYCRMSCPVLKTPFQILFRLHFAILVQHYCALSKKVVLFKCIFVLCCKTFGFLGYPILGFVIILYSIYGLLKPINNPSLCGLWYLNYFNNGQITNKIQIVIFPMEFNVSSF